MYTAPKRVADMSHDEKITHYTLARQDSEASLKRCLASGSSSVQVQRAIYRHKSSIAICNKILTELKGSTNETTA